MGFIVKWVGILVVAAWISWLVATKTANHHVALGSFSVAWSVIAFLVLLVFLGYRIKVK